MNSHVVALNPGQLQTPLGYTNLDALPLQGYTAEAEVKGETVALILARRRGRTSQGNVLQQQLA